MRKDISMPQLNSPLSGRFHLTGLLLPLLALSVTFTSKPVYPDTLLHKMISSSFILCATVVFYQACRKNMLLYSIPLVVIFLRIMRFGYSDASGASEGGVLEIIYAFPYIALILVVGSKMLRDCPALMFRQITWLCAASAVLSLMQIMGVQWAQRLTNYYHIKGGSLESYLFVPWQDLPPATDVTGMQMRPVGFASANNIVSQYLVFFYAFGVLWFMDKNQRRQSPLIWMFVISFACALSGAKLVLSSVVLINLAAVAIAKRGHRVNLLRVPLATILAYVCYGLLFPGVFVNNFNVDLFAFNIMIRLIDLLQHESIPYADAAVLFLSQYQTGEFTAKHFQHVFIGIEKLDEGMITGVGVLISYWPVILSLVLLIAPFWIIRLRKLARGSTVDIQRAPVVMLVASASALAGGPFLFTSYYWFFTSFALYPLSALLLRHPRGTYNIDYKKS